jgi:hypothetical protein
MPKPDSQRDLEALLKLTEENRAELKRTQQKVENLEAAIQTMRNSRNEAEQKRGKRKIN